MIKTLQNTLKQDKEHLSVPKSVQDTRESHRIAGRPYMGQLSLTIAEVLPMVSDFLTVASFAVLMLTKLLLNSCSFTGLLNY